MASLGTGGFAYSQTYYQEEEVQVHNLPVLVAVSHNPSEVLLTSLATVLHDDEICCGKGSALEDSAEAADPKSLKDIATKLGGRHLLSDGRPIQIAAEFLTPDVATASRVIATLNDQRPWLLLWNSHLYVVYGVEYVRTVDNPYGAPSFVIRKFLLWDTRYSDERRKILYDRETEDPSKVQGLLSLQFRME